MSQGVACCKFCGAQYRLVTIFKETWTACVKPGVNGMSVAVRAGHQQSVEPGRRNTLVRCSGKAALLLICHTQRSLMPKVQPVP